MSSAIHTSFQELTEEDFGAYADTLVEGHPSSSERKHALSYMQHINSADKAALNTELDTLKTKRLAQRKKQTKIDSLIEQHAFDFSRQSALFTPQVVTDSQVATLLTQDGQEVYIKGRSMTTDLLISGDNVLLDGQGNEGSARTEALVNTATVTGQLRVSGDNVVIRGVNFVSTGEKALIFPTSCSNLTLEDCKFTGPAGHSDSKWWYGDDNLYSGNVTVINCWVQDFSSWMLADFSTSSSAAQSALKRVRIKKCLFKNNLGSMAARGKISDPMKLYSFTNNKITQTALHASFWDVHEASGGVLKVVCTGNEYVGPTGADADVTSKKGFFQCWSKNSKPWTLMYKDNTLSNTRCGGKVATMASFYAVNAADEDQTLVDLSATLTNVYKAFSWIYKKADGTTPSAEKWLRNDATYAPENAATYPSPPGAPTVVNPQNYDIVQPP